MCSGLASELKVMALKGSHSLRYYLWGLQARGQIDIQTSCIYG